MKSEYSGVPPVNRKSEEFMISAEGHLSEEGIAVCVDALFENQIETLPEAMSSHLSECSDCRREVVSVWELLREERKQRRVFEPVPTGIARGRQRIFTYIYRVAAAVVVCLSAGILAYFGWRLNEERNAAGKPNAAIEQAEKQTAAQTEGNSVSATSKLATALEVSPTLEGLVNSTSRTTSIRVLSPKTSETVSGSVVFAWKGIGERSVELQILSNHEKVLWTLEKAHSPVRFTAPLSDGIYYWKIAENGELLYVGKFFTRRSSP